VAERSPRHARRPVAYTILILVAAAILAACVAATWRLSHETHEAPAEVAAS
jgi:hypothetical protein